MIRAWHLDPEAPSFKELILRHGGDDALKRILQFTDADSRE
jgi:hypothetical protein